MKPDYVYKMLCKLKIHKVTAYDNIYYISCFIIYMNFSLEVRVLNIVHFLFKLSYNLSYILHSHTRWDSSTTTWLLFVVVILC